MMQLCIFAPILSLYFQCPNTPHYSLPALLIFNCSLAICGVTRYNSLMVATWTPHPITRSALPVRHRTVEVLAWRGAKGRANGRDQWKYASREGRLPIISTGGNIVGKDYAFGVGQRYGQQRVVISPSVSAGVDWNSFTASVAEKWGLDDAGWYGAVHYDTDHPHIHIIAETEAPWGEEVILTVPVLQQWKCHAEHLLTKIVGRG